MAGYNNLLNNLLPPTDPDLFPVYFGFPPFTLILVQDFSIFCALDSLLVEILDIGKTRGKPPGNMPVLTGGYQRYAREGYTRYLDLPA